MTKEQSKQIATWAGYAYNQAQYFADLVDPKRDHSKPMANKLDGITRLARDIVFELTGKLPNE